MYIENVGKIIKELRESQNMSQETLGKSIGVNKTTVNRYETGDIDIKRTIAIKLAEVFNVHPSYIMGWQASENDQKSIGKTLTLYEIEILKKYREMNNNNRIKLYEYVSDLYIVDQFKKEQSSENYNIAAWGADETDGISQSTIEEVTT